MSSMSRTNRRADRATTEPITSGSAPAIRSLEYVGEVQVAPLKLGGGMLGQSAESIYSRRDDYQPVAPSS